MKVLFDQPDATASFQIRQKTVERRIEEERVEIFVKEILRLYELAEVFAAFERLGGHDEAVERTMRVTRARFQTLRAAGFDLALIHDGAHAVHIL